MRSDMARNNKLFNFTFKLNQRIKAASITKTDEWSLQKDSLSKKMPFNLIDKTPEYSAYFCNLPLKFFTRTSFVFKVKNQIPNIFCNSCFYSFIKYKNHLHKKEEWEIIRHKLVITQFHYEYSRIDLYLFDIYLKDTLVGHIARKSTVPYNRVIFIAIELSNINDLIFDKYSYIEIERNFRSADYAKMYLKQNFSNILKYYKFKIDNYDLQ